MEEFHCQATGSITFPARQFLGSLGMLIDRLTDFWGSQGSEDIGGARIRTENQAVMSRLL